MNWLIREKMFTYFYNRFRPVSCMYYIKCGVNSSLLTKSWLLHKVFGTLDHCFIMTRSIDKESDILQIYFCVIFRETRHHAQVHVTSGTLVHCALFLAAKRTQTAEQWGDFAGQCLLWLLLLRLPAVVPPLLLPQNNLLTSLAFTPDT